jgi:branched-chain amino acid transport system ATP-binding protein
MLAGASPRAILRAGVGHVPQERSLFRELTVRTNVELGGFLLNNKELVKERYASVLELFPMLKERERQRAGTLSGGQQKLVEFARCLMLRPTVMVLDEPSQGLDPSTRGLVFSTLRRMKEAGQAMLLVEQNARAGLELSDYGLVLEGGRVRLQGPAQEVLANPEIGRLYLGSNRR